MSIPRSVPRANQLSNFDVLVELSESAKASTLHGSLQKLISAGTGWNSSTPPVSSAAAQLSSVVTLGATAFYLPPSLSHIKTCLITPLFKYQTHFDKMQAHRRLASATNTSSGEKDIADDNSDTETAGAASVAASLVVPYFTVEDVQTEAFVSTTLPLLQSLRSILSPSRVVCVFVGIREFLTASGEMACISPSPIFSASLPHEEKQHTSSVAFSPSTLSLSVLQSVHQLDELMCSLVIDAGFDYNETHSLELTAEFIAKAALSVSLSRGRKPNSYFKCRPQGCMTLNKETTSSILRLWISQLMQIPGISEEVAKAIAQKYPTAYHLIEGFSTLSNTKPEDSQLSFLSELAIPSRNGNRKLGLAISKRLYKFYHKETTAWQPL